MNKTSKLTLLLLCLMFLFVFLLFFVVGILFFSKTKTKNVIPHKVGQYRYLKYDPDTDTSNFGFMDIPENLFRNNYVNYKTSSSSHILVTPIGSSDEEYICRGSCLCQDSTRRSHSGVLSRSLIFLVSALSSSYAIKLAHQHFENSCHEQFQSTCDQIEPEVEVCVSAKRREPEQLNLWGDDVLDPDKKKREEEAKQKRMEELAAMDPIQRKIEEELDRHMAGIDEEKTRKPSFDFDLKVKDPKQKGTFKCKGKCYTLQFRPYWEKRAEEKTLHPKMLQTWRYNYDTIQFMADQRNCEEMELEKEVTVLFDPKVLENMKVTEKIEIAKEEFLREHLDVFCRHGTIEKLQLENPEWAQIQTEFHFCLGYDVNGENNEVECVLGVEKAGKESAS